YLALMGPLSRMPQTRFKSSGQSVVYQNRRRAIVLYDKAAESRRSKMVLPEALRGRHLLRLELRFLSKLSTVFGLPVTVADLRDPGFQGQLLAAAGLASL